MKPVSILVIIGTRPEAIKLAPVIKSLKKKPDFQLRVCFTGQHREMLKQTVEDLEIKADWELNLMEPGQSLPSFSSLCLRKISEVLDQAKAHCILVQGDTSTSFMGALAGFYHKIPIGHVEAGLRTGKKYSPFPEEMNRKLLASLSDYHFCPTKKAVQNLQGEGISESQVFQTGNTGIDILKEEWDKNRTVEGLRKYSEGPKTFLVTAHRRENFGEGLEGICQALLDLTTQYPQYRFVYPVHPNPEVRALAYRTLHNQDRIHLLDPLDYSELIYLLRYSAGVLSDSGGIQEEAPTLGLHTLILRKDTERPEALETGYGHLVGTDPRAIIQTFDKLESSGAFEKKANWKPSLFGDGTAGEKIADILERFLVY